MRLFYASQQGLSKVGEEGVKSEANASPSASPNKKRAYGKSPKTLILVD